MDGKTLARIGAVAFIALAIVATAIEMTRHDDPVDETATITRPVVEQDPLADELARCGKIGEAGGRDPSCLKAWAENRRRFLGKPASAAPFAPSASAAPTTLFPGASNAADPAMPAPQPEATPAATPLQSGER